MIPVHNWLFLLAFHWRDVGVVDDALVGGCDFDRPWDVAARLLDEALARLWRRGLELRFASFADTGPRPRGALDLPETLRARLEHRGHLAFRYEDLTTDTPANRLLKAATLALLRAPDVAPAVRARLRRHLDLLADVALVAPAVAARAPVEPPRRERTYAEALHVARLVLLHQLADGQLADTGRAARGATRLRVPQDRLGEIFEGFVRGAAHFFCAPRATVQRPTLEFATAGTSARARSLLPDQRLDACVRWVDGAAVVLECKFYEQPLVTHHHGDQQRLRSGHLYQLTSYLRAVARRERAVAGVLVYARVDNELDECFGLEGFAVRVVALDLAADWRALRDQTRDVVGWRGDAAHGARAGDDEPPATDETQQTD